MKNTIAHLPPHKQEELQQIITTVATYKNVAMVILFGSYAKDTWVEDEYFEKGTHYTYRSDYDLLIVLTNEAEKQKYKIQRTLEQQLIATGEVTTPISAIYHGIKHVNRMLREGNYFFREITTQGIRLYDDQSFVLATAEQLDTKQAQQKAQDYFDQWYKSAKEFLEFSQIASQKEYYHKAAFELHQAVERFYTTILLVYTDYKPKAHDLALLGKRVEMCDARFAVFPKTTEADKQLFELLCRAYIDARYKMKEYQITATQLTQLSTYVQQLSEQTETLCTARIQNLANH